MQKYSTNRKGKGELTKKWKQAEIISSLRIHVKTWNWVYKSWVRPELQHEVIRRPVHSITTTAWRDIMSWALNMLKRSCGKGKYQSMNNTKIGMKVDNSYQKNKRCQD